jgi:hypothetical protein
VAAFESIPAGTSVTDSFSFTVSDSHGQTATATESIVVAVPVEAINAEDDIGSIDVQGNNNGNQHSHHHHGRDCDDGKNNTGGNSNSSAVLNVDIAHGVLANDLHDADDPLHVASVNGNAGSVGTMITLASGAHLTLNADGSYIYDPSTIAILNQLSSGSFHDTFSYTASDGHGNVDTAIVDITVNVDGNNNNNHHHHHRHDHHDEYGHREHYSHNPGHDEGQWNWHNEHHGHSGHNDILSHMPEELGGHGGNSNSHGNGWNNAGNDSSQHGGHDSMGGAALMMAQLEHGSSMHH